MTQTSVEQSTMTVVRLAQGTREPSNGGRLRESPPGASLQAEHLLGRPLGTFLHFVTFEVCHICYAHSGILSRGTLLCVRGMAITSRYALRVSVDFTVFVLPYHVWCAIFDNVNCCAIQR